MSRSYDGRRFRMVQNTANGDVGTETTFEYRQEGAVVWATYRGGGVAFGTLVTTSAEDGTLDMRYSHVNGLGVLMTGMCETTSEVLPDGRLRLHERWRWTSGDGSSGDGSSGTSVLEEID